MQCDLKMLQCMLLASHVGLGIVQGAMFAPLKLGLCLTVQPLPKPGLAQYGCEDPIWLGSATVMTSRFMLVVLDCALTYIQC